MSQITHSALITNSKDATSRCYALVDCNSFYCSCEKLFRPDLADKPVIVLSNNDGCIVARSREAKALGVRMGVPFHQWKKFCIEHGVSWFSSNYPLYGDLSNRVMTVLRDFCPRVEQYSIDEAFLDLSGMPYAATQEWCDKLVRTVKQWTGIPVSIGIAKTKTLAKVANHYAKDTGKGGAVLLFDKAIDKILAEQKPDDIWGVAGRTAARLNRWSIWSALDLKNAEPLLIRKHFNIVLERTVRELKGEACIAFEDNIDKRKNIQVSRSFGNLVSDFAELEQAVATYATRAAEKLRRQGSVTNGVYVYLRTNPHRDDPQYTPGIAAPFIIPTASSFELVDTAVKLLRQIYREGYLFQKAGVMLLDIVDESMHQQGDLFGMTEQILKRKELMSTLDKLNNTYGRGTIRVAAQGFDGNGWKLRSQFLSPRYTTNWQRSL